MAFASGSHLGTNYLVVIDLLQLKHGSKFAFLYNRVAIMSQQQLSERVAVTPKAAAVIDQLRKKPGDLKVTR